MRKRSRHFVALIRRDHYSEAIYEIYWVVICTHCFDQLTARVFIIWFDNAAFGIGLNL